MKCLPHDIGISSARRAAVRWGLWLIMGVALVRPAFAETPQEAHREEQRLDHIESAVTQAREALEKKETASASTDVQEEPSPSAILETLKKRAAEAIARRHARRWALTTNTTISTTIETNPNLDSSRKGDGFFEEDEDITFHWHWFTGMAQDVGYRVTNVNYMELTDNNYSDNTGYTTVRYTPVKWLRATAGYEFTGLNYYRNSGSTLLSQRIYAQLRHTLPKNLYYQVGWSHIDRYYLNKEARNGDGNDTDNNRRDTRHTMHVETGAVLWGTLLKVRHEAAFHFSNDAFQDFYNYQSYKVRATVAREFLEKWQASGTFSFERKNYTERLVSTSVIKAEYDNSYSYGVNLTYALSPNVSLVYDYSRKKLDSNTPSSEYTDTTNQFSLSASF